MASAKSSTDSAHTKEGYRNSIKITLTTQLLSDLLIAREGLQDPEWGSPEADALDNALTTVTIPGHLQPQLVRRLGIVLNHDCGDEDIPSAALLVGKLTADQQFSFDQVQALISGRSIVGMVV